MFIVYTNYYQSDMSSLSASASQVWSHGNEIEFRLGRIIGGSFVAGLTSLQFAKILVKMRSKYGDKMDLIHQVDHIKGNHRLSVFGNGKEALISKSKRVKHDYQGKGLAFDVRVSATTEEVFPICADLRVPILESPDMVREKDRARFKMDGFFVDMTVTSNVFSKGVVSGDTELPNIGYEVEVEITDKRSIDEAAGYIMMFLKWIGESNGSENYFKRFQFQKESDNSFTFPVLPPM